jgi:hypothetical protein
VSSKLWGVLGVIGPHGEITARKVRDVRTQGHEDVGMLEEEGRWRYVGDNQIVFWWFNPSDKETAIVQAWLEDHGYPVRRHENIRQGVAMAAAHGHFIEHLVDTLLA